MWGAYPDNIWAVGNNGKIAYRDGSGTWTFQDSNWFGPTPFNAVWGFSKDDVIVAGNVGKVRRFDGTAWQVVETKTPKKTQFGDAWPSDQVVPPESTDLNYVGLFAQDPDNIWLFDRNGLLVQYNNDYEL